MIRARGIEKSYAAFRAVHPMDLDVHRGEVFGFLGLNGAGKTTTLRMLAGVLPPSAGTIVIDGKDLHDDPVEARRVLGFIPDRPYLYDKLTAREYLNFIGEIYGMSRDVLSERLVTVLELHGLLAQADALVESFSHGMKQRLVLAGALLHEPRLLIVDEPMVGLDPSGAKQIKRTFREFVEAGRTVFLSTHTLTVAAEICDRIAIIHGGRIAALGTPAEVCGSRSLEDVFMTITGSPL